MISVILPTYRFNTKERIKILKDYREHILTIEDPPTDEFIDIVDDRVGDINHFLDITLRSLERQSNKNELEILLCHKYPEDVKDLVKDYDMNIKVLKEKPSIWHKLGDYPTVNNIRNTGIIKSSGDLLWFLDDYTFFNSDVTNDISNKWKNGETITSRSMRRIRYQYDGETEHKTPNRSHFLFGNMSSGFNFTLYEFGEIIPQQCTWTYSCTVSKEDCLEINGFDEIYDGSFGGTDEDFGLRLQKNGSSYDRVLANNIIYEFGHDSKRKKGRESVRIDRMFRKINRQLPIPIHIRANNWKPTKSNNNRYKKWHLNKYGEIDDNWDNFMNVPLYDIEKLK
jgi:hypothetical protein